MIEVNMRKEDVPNVGEPDAHFGQASLQAVERGGGARVYDRRLRTVDPIGRDRARKAKVNDVDRRNGHGHIGAASR
jgi:hypothetical protein